MAARPPPATDPRKQPSSISAATATATTAAQQQQQYSRGGRQGSQSNPNDDRHSRYPHRPHQHHSRPHQHHPQHQPQQKQQQQVRPRSRPPRKKAWKDPRAAENCDTNDGVVPNMPLHYHSRDPRVVVWTGSHNHYDSKKGGGFASSSAVVDPPTTYRRPPSNHAPFLERRDNHDPYYNDRSGHPTNHPNHNSRRSRIMMRSNHPPPRPPQSSHHHHDSRHNNSNRVDKNNNRIPTKSFASIPKDAMNTKSAAARPLARRMPQTTKAPHTCQKIAVGASLFPTTTTAPILPVPPPPSILEQSSASLLSPPAEQTTKTMTTGKKRPRNLIGKSLHENNHASSHVSTSTTTATTTTQTTVSDKDTPNGKGGNVAHSSTASTRPKTVLHQKTSMNPKTETKLEKKRALKNAYKKRRRERARSMKMVRNHTSNTMKALRRMADNKETMIDTPKDGCRDGTNKVLNIPQNMPPPNNRGTTVPSRRSDDMPFLVEQDPSRVVVDLVGPSSHEDAWNENLETTSSRDDEIYVDPDTIACPTPYASKRRARSSRVTAQKEPLNLDIYMDPDAISDSNEHVPVHPLHPHDTIIASNKVLPSAKQSTPNVIVLLDDDDPPENEPGHSKKARREESREKESAKVEIRPPCRDIGSIMKSAIRSIPETIVTKTATKQSLIIAGSNTNTHDDPDTFANTIPLDASVYPQRSCSVNDVDNIYIDPDAISHVGEKETYVDPENHIPKETGAAPRAKPTKLVDDVIELLDDEISPRKELHPRTTGGLSNEARKAILKATRAIQGVEIVVPSIPNPSVRTDPNNASPVYYNVETSWNVKVPHALGSSVYSLDDVIAAKKTISKSNAMNTNITSIAASLKTIDVDADTISTPTLVASIHPQSPCDVNNEPLGGLYIDPDAISDDAEGEVLYVDPDQITNNVCAPLAKMRKLDVMERNDEYSPREERHRRERELKYVTSDSQKHDVRKDTLKMTSTKQPLEEVGVQNGPLPSASVEQKDAAVGNALDGSSKKENLRQDSHEIDLTVHSQFGSVGVANTISGNVVVTNKGKRYVVLIEGDVEDEDDEVLLMDTVDTLKGDEPSDLHVDPDATISDKDAVSENEPVDDIYIDPDAIMPGNAYVDPDAISISSEGDNIFDVDSTHDLNTSQIDTKPHTVEAAVEVSTGESDEYLFVHTTKSHSVDSVLKESNESDTTMGCLDDNKGDQEGYLKAKNVSTGATSLAASLKAAETPGINSEYDDCVILDTEGGSSVIHVSHSGESTETILPVASEQMYQDSDEMEETNALDDMRKRKPIQLDDNTTSEVYPPLVHNVSNDIPQIEIDLCSGVDNVAVNDEDGKDPVAKGGRGKRSKHVENEVPLPRRETQTKKKKRFLPKRQRTTNNESSPESCPAAESSNPNALPTVASVDLTNDPPEDTTEDEDTTRSADTPTSIPKPGSNPPGLFSVDPTQSTSRPNYVPFKLKKHSPFVPYSKRNDYAFSSTQQAEQERLLQESATRARLFLQQQQQQQNGYYQCQTMRYGTTPTFRCVLENIAQIHPNHWSWLDPHARLGLPSNAPITDIKRQYRRLALLYHPDKARHHDALEMFHGIKSAYEMLTNTT